LWSVLPTKAFAVLGEGTVRARRWGVYAFRSKARNAGKSPCIQIVSLRADPALGDAFSVFGGGPDCGSLAPPADVPVVSQIAYESVKGTALAMTAATTVIEAVFELESGAVLTRKTKLLSERQALKANLERFRYLAFGVPYDVCVEGISGFDAAGLEVIHTRTEKCVTD
jgi:hypothetical protein